VRVNNCRNPVSTIPACLQRFFTMPNTSKAMMRTPAVPHVALLVETSLASGREILRGVARYVREQGPWSLFHAPRGLEESVPTWLGSWKGDGIIARITTPALAKLLQKLKVPVVDVLGLVPDCGLPLVHVNDVEIAKQAFTHFAQRGFRRFAFFGLAGENWSQRRRDAFLEEARKLDASPAMFEMTRREIETTPWEKRQDQLAHWLKGLPKPAGLMVCSDQRGPDVLEACRRISIQVPDEISIVGVDNDEPLCEVCNPPMSSVWPNHFGVGYEAAGLLHRLMQGQGTDAETMLVAPRGLVTRQSSDVLAVEDAMVAAALRVIREEACNGISVDELSLKVGASRSVLQRRFSALLGQTIHDRLIDQRIKRAIELLTSTGLPMIEIAERCGFKHQEYMGAVFRERCGKTPRAFRELGKGTSAPGR
jgi:LacI family transcriptional regulator